MNRNFFIVVTNSNIYKADFFEKIMAIEKIVVGKELKNLSRERILRGQKVKRNSKIKKIALIGAAMLALGSAIYVPKIRDERNFKQAYNQAIEQYGDANRDGFVSKEEAKELLNDIFYKTGISFSSSGAVYSSLSSGEASYSSGKRVPTSTLTKIIKEYIDNPLRIK
jgi:hypothetical protein